MPVPAAVELLPRPTGGRVFVDRRTVRLGDVDRRGRLRLDATARFLQDIATDDASDAGLDRRYGWLVRRTLVDTAVPASIGEHLDVATWCTGLGRSWAERRSSIVGSRGARIDAVSLWVQIEIGTGRPARLADDFTDAYGATANERTVSARLALPPPPEDGDPMVMPWVTRRTDLDPFGHVNNAVNWEFLEEAAQLDDHDRIGRAEMEYLQPVTHDLATRLVIDRGDGTGGRVDAWLVADEVVLSATRWRAGGSPLRPG